MMTSLFRKVLLLLLSMSVFFTLSNVGISALSAITNLKAVSISSTSIKLTWTGVTSASGYEIYRAKSGGAYELSGNVTTTSYTDASAVFNTTYNYKVRAYVQSTAGTTYSAFSAVVSAKAIPTTPLISVSAITYNSISLQWGLITGAAGYEVYRSTASTYGFTLIKAITTNKLSDLNLTFNKTYYYKIRSYQLAGTTKIYSPYSAAITVKTALQKPSLRLVDSGLSSIRVSWGAVPGAEKYVIYRYTATTSLKLATITTTEYTDSGLPQGQFYSYKVQAVRMSGTTAVMGALSNEIKAYSLPLMKPTSNLDGNYWLINPSSGAYLNGYSASATNFPYYVVSSPGDGSTEQIFKFVKNSDGTYTIWIKRYNQVLTVLGNTAAGSIVATAPDTGAANQRFIISSVDGRGMVISVSTNQHLVLTLTAEKTYATKTHYYIKLSTYAGSSNQYWTMTTYPQDNPILPLSLSDGRWYGLTYPNHHIFGSPLVTYNYQFSAVDFNMLNNADKGKNVFAVQDGTVVSIGTGYVIIKHTKPLVIRSGYVYLVWYTLYGHMNQAPLYIGKVVKKGEVIGTVGNKIATGSISEHLHFVICTSYSANSTISQSISPYWLFGDYANMDLYADNPDLVRVPAGLYEKTIFRPMP